MNNHEEIQDIPQSATKTKKKIRISAVWIIPLLAALVALGIAVQKIVNEGPTITIVFKKAEGIEAGKTFVKYKDVNIGQVETVKLSPDFTKVVVTAKIEKSAAGLIVEDSQFWIESPRVTLSGISGFGTLLAGNHIGLETGKSTKARKVFTGLELPPSITVDQPGRQFILHAETLGSIGIGSPLYYRQLNVGRVIGYDLTANGRAIDIRIFVNAPYDKHVTTQTRFWHASGIDVEMGAKGLSVQTQSVLSLLIGGIAFEEPDFSPPGEAKTAEEGAAFNLFSDRAAATKKREDLIANAILYFNESLRGLSVGAPVTYAGLPMGEVTGVGLEYNPKTESIQPRVDVALYPNVLIAHVRNSGKAHEKAKNQNWRGALMQRMIDRGLRAQLRSGSLVTGQLYVALDYFPNAAKTGKIDFNKSPYEFPVMPSSLQDMEHKVTGIIAKIDKIPFEAIGGDVRKAVDSLNKLLQDADGLLNRLDGEMLPEIRTTVQELRKAVSTAERTLAGAEKTLVGKDSPTQQELRSALQEVSRAARSINELIEYLERNPNALIRGKAQEAPQ
jgi:paraquat-inducible protein B